MSFDNSLFNRDVGYYEYIPGKMWLPGKLVGRMTWTRRAVDAAINVELKDSDVMLATYPKTGLTWTMAMVQLIQNAKDLECHNNIKVHAVSEQLPIPFMETERKSGETGADLFQKLQSPRFMQTHLPCQLWKTALEKCPELKIIRTIRNPKDTLVSYFHHMKNDEIMGGFNGSWDQFFQLFKEKKLPYGDFFEVNAEWFKLFQNRKNILVLKYEEMKKDHRGHVLKIAQFLDKEISHKVIDIIVQKTTFQNMSKDVNPVVKTYDTWKKDGDFVRKGEVGDWMNYFSDEQSEYVDCRSEEYLEPLGIQFQYN